MTWGWCRSCERAVLLDGPPGPEDFVSREGNVLMLCEVCKAHEPESPAALQYILDGFPPIHAESIYSPHKYGSLVAKVQAGFSWLREVRVRKTIKKKRGTQFDDLIGEEGDDDYV